jgi:hypothetical protein
MLTVRQSCFFNHSIDNTYTNAPESSTSISESSHRRVPSPPPLQQKSHTMSAPSSSYLTNACRVSVPLIKMRDFAYEPILSSCKASEIFDPAPYLIAAYWHMRNPRKNYLSSPQGLFRLIKMGWLTSPTSNATSTRPN